MLGVGVVVWVTCCYESVRRSVTEAVLEWIGRSHVIVEPVEGVWAVFDERVERLVAGLSDVAATTVRTREYVEAASASTAKDFERIEISGIVPEKELSFRPYRMLAGRFLRADDADGLMIEKLLADELKLGVGGTLLLRKFDPPNPPREFSIVGVVDRRRASVNQAPMVWGRMADVQSLCSLPGRVKAVDIILSDPSIENIQRAAVELRRMLDERGDSIDKGDHQAQALEVKTTEAQIRKLSAAQGLLQFIMLLVACVVLLTAFFIILSSMSMGVTERIAELGLLRCVGVTRGQLAGFVLLQSLPIGLAGTLAGVPLGFLLQWLTLRAAPQYIGHMALSVSGIVLGVCGGIGTTLLGAAAPALSAFAVSPAEAVRPHARPRPTVLVWLSGLGGAVLVLSHELLTRSFAGDEFAAFDSRAVAALLLLYAGFACAAPAVMFVIGRYATLLAATLLRLRPQLLGEEIDKSPFRSAAICSSLMVGLSLIVGLVVWGESVKQGWQFPREFPDAMLYSYDMLPLDDVRALAATPGVAQFTVVDDFAFSMSPPSFLRPLRLLDQFSRFLAIDPDTGFAIVKLAFLEGTEREAREKLERGGHVLLTREFAKARNLRVGDTIKIWVDHRSASFSVAGVVASPGLDIAISFFNATTYFQTYAVGAIFGTLDDAQRLFGRRSGKLMLMNFSFQEADESRIGQSDQQPIALPSGRPGQSGPAPARGPRPSFALGAGPVPGDGPEEHVVNQMLGKLGWPSKAFVTARELKREIDRNINRVTLLLSVIPLVGLFISALGLANLMAANVASRSREIAVLRAIGLTRSQTMRMVIGEALVIGLLGSGMGIALGIALGRASNTMTRALSGFAPPLAIPWPLVLAGAGLATMLCLLAALTPARYASRSNVVGVLSDL
jgi:putative ABC transport system permease protein